MQISFFEEFPNTENLSKLDLISFPIKLYLADYSIEGYKQYKKELQEKYKHIKEVIWWPVLNMKEGYWFSPWSKRKALLRTFDHLLYEKVPIMWDAEFPKKRMLLFTQMFWYFTNKKLIKAFFKKYQGKIYTAEYFTDNTFMKKFLESVCLIFDPNEYPITKIKMMYSSTNKRLTEGMMRYEIKDYKEKYKDKFAVGLGLLAWGINGNEALLSLEQLERDLNICKSLNVKEVVIFRIGGLTKEQTNLLKKYAS